MTKKEFATRLLMLLLPWYVSRNLPSVLLKAIFGDPGAPLGGWPPGLSFADWLALGPDAPIPADWLLVPPIDPYGIPPFYQPGPGSTPASRPARLALAWYDYVSIEYWIEPEDKSMLWSVDHWELQDSFEESKLWREPSWTDSWRPTKYRITHDCPDLSWNLKDLDGMNLSEDASFLSGAENTIIWGDYNLHLFEFYFEELGSITHIEFYGLYAPPP